MKVREVRLFKSPETSFIFYHEQDEFTDWHHHPEYELVIILKGEGIRLIGDHIERFREGEIVFLGSYLPHEWRCDQQYYHSSGEFLGECIVIQFLHNSFGEGFFELPENSAINNFFTKASQGCKIHGETQNNIKNLMQGMLTMDDVERLYTLFSIFKILSTTDEYRLLSSPAFLKPYTATENDSLMSVIQFIHQNFQKDIKVAELLEISNMSNTTFFTSFKKLYRMTFKKYLLNIRIGYACRLIVNGTYNISQIAYESGFENLSNFNRQFKAIKGCTPGEYKKHHRRKDLLQMETV
jgi:AraC-like DNA-binding protein